METHTYRRPKEKLQADLSSWTTIPQVVAADGGHDIHIDRPELVIQTVAEIVKTTREN